MKILIIAPGFPTLANKELGSMGGEFLLAEAQAYHSAGAEVTVLTPHAPGLPLQEVIAEGLKVIRFRYFFPTKWQLIRSAAPLYSKQHMLAKLLQLPLFLTAFVCAIAWHMRRHDIVHANWTPTAFLALPFQWLYKIPVLLTYRGSDLRLLPKWFNRFITRNVRAVLDVWGDNAGANALRAAFPARYIKLPLISRSAAPADCDAAGPWGEKEVHFAFISRLVADGIEHMKGTTAIIPATKIVNGHLDEFIVDIIGDGPERTTMEEQSERLGVKERVKMHGFQRNVFPYICRSIAVIASTGLSGVVQEAGLSSRLLIIPDIPEKNEGLWVHNENALLYKPGSAESLADAMVYAAQNPENTRRIAEAGYKTVSKYVSTVEAGGEIYLTAFKVILNENVA